jgi:hypothetical protein
MKLELFFVAVAILGAAACGGEGAIHVGVCDPDDAPCPYGSARGGTTPPVGNAADAGRTTNDAGVAESGYDGDSGTNNGGSTSSGGYGGGGSTSSGGHGSSGSSGGYASSGGASTGGSGGTGTGGTSGGTSGSGGGAGAGSSSGSGGTSGQNDAGPGLCAPGNACGGLWACSDDCYTEKCCSLVCDCTDPSGQSGTLECTMTCP